MEKIIFLDIDGVLNDNYGEQKFLPSCVEIAKRLIIENDAKVVVISSLQGAGTAAKRKKLIDELNNIGIKVYDYIDPNFEGYINDIFLPSRLIGIVDYLKKNKNCSYVILDDDYHDDYIFLGLNCYKCDMWKGLQFDALNDIRFEKVDYVIFKEINYSYRQLGHYERATNNLIKVLKRIKGNL